MDDADSWRHVRPFSNIVSFIEADGRLTLRHSESCECFSYSPEDAVMWIVLQRHEWRLDESAQALSQMWAKDLLWTRVKLSRWLDELTYAGLIEEI